MTIGTVTYTLAADFTVFFQLLGIGILVEILRRLGFAFLKARAEEA